MIGERTAVRILKKINIGSVYDVGEENFYGYKGRDLISGLP